MEKHISPETLYEIVAATMLGWRFPELTAQNSPLPSGNVRQQVVDDDTGRVLISYEINPRDNRIQRIISPEPQIQ